MADGKVVCKVDADELDVVVVGSGGGGLTAALTAALEGLRVVVVEKTPYYGGTTAVSGGGIWIPNNLHQVKAGTSDTPEKAGLFLRTILGDRVSAARQDTYLRCGPEMVAELHDRTRWVRFGHWSIPDYYPEVVGGSVEGRTLDPELVDGRELGDERARLRPPTPVMDTHGITVKAKEFTKLAMMGRTWEGRAMAGKVLLRFCASKLAGAKPLGAGQALIARLRLALRDLDVPVWVDTPLVELITDRSGETVRVTGVTVEQDGRPMAIRTRLGVVLAAGGFSTSQVLREKYLPQPTDIRWTLVPEGQDGDAITAGMAVGAATDLLDKVWGQATALLPLDKNAPPVPLLALMERLTPQAIVVNSAGERYTKESLPYAEFQEEMYQHNRDDAVTIPSWLVFDQTAKNRYIFFRTMPRQPFPKRWLNEGYVLRADTIAALARRMEVPVDSLDATVARYNELARSGHDDDFGKGDSAFDRFYGDPTENHPNLAPLDRGPYYAVRMWPGDISTKGGLLTNEHAQVLSESGRVIPGLYATGNCAASVMGEKYPGPGGTLGPAMVFGYVAAKHLAARATNEGDDEHSRAD
jgi:3-oxosteroid 1-dehydrogenase